MKEFVLRLLALADISVNELKLASKTRHHLVRAPGLLRSPFWP